jgi:hypothetical protein
MRSCVMLKKKDEHSPCPTVEVLRRNIYQGYVQKCFEFKKYFVISGDHCCNPNGGRRIEGGHKFKVTVIIII